MTAATVECEKAEAAGFKQGRYARRGGVEEEEVQGRGARGGVGGGVKGRSESRNNEMRRMGSLAGSRGGEEGRERLAIR